MFKFLDVYKKDLSEFATTTTKPISKLFSNLVYDDVKEEKKQKKTEDEKKENQDFKFENSTFLNDITKEEEKRARYYEMKPFDEWKKEEENVNKKREEITILLEENKELKTIFSEIVPVKIPYEDFWGRFFYRKQLFNEDNNKKKRLEKAKAEEQSFHEDLSWEDDEELGKELEALKKENEILKKNLKIEEKLEELKSEYQKTINSQKLELEKLQSQKTKKDNEEELQNFGTLKSTILEILKQKEETITITGMKDMLKSKTPFLFNGIGDPEKK